MYPNSLILSITYKGTVYYNTVVHSWQSVAEKRTEKAKKKKKKKNLHFWGLGYSTSYWLN